MALLKCTSVSRSITEAVNPFSGQQSYHYFSLFLVKMSVEKTKNGHCKERTEVRSEVLELNAKRTQIENEMKEYNAILRTVS